MLAHVTVYSNQQTNMASEHNNPFKKFKKAGAAKLSGEAVHDLMKRKAAKKGANWIQGAIKKPGALHRELGVKEGDKIPAKKLRTAATKGGKLGARARLAETLKGMKHKKAKKGVTSMGGDVEEKKAKKRKGVIGMTGDVEMKSAKHRKHSEQAIKGLEKFTKEESKEKKSKKYKHAEKDAMCMKCKAAHEKHSGKE